MNGRVRQPPRRGGFMMFELLAAIILLGVFALVATRLFTWSMRVTAEAPQSEGQILLFDSMLEQLRDDAWTSANVRTIDERSIDVNDGAIRWAVGADGSVTRTSTGGETRAWRAVGQRVRFEPDEAGVVVRVLDARGAAADRILLPSEVVLLRRTVR
jgi:type II secretory pathway pseudopilin PulG